MGTWPISRTSQRLTGARSETFATRDSVSSTSASRHGGAPPSPRLAGAAAAPADARSERPLLGILLITAAVFAFACSDASAKVLMDTLSAVQVTWIRWAVFAAALVPPALWVGPGAIRSAKPALQVWRALGVVVSALLFIAALGLLPLPETTAIAFVSPLYVTALSVPFLGERVGPRRWAAVVVGLVGVLIVVRPGADAFDPAAFLPLIASLIWASALIITRKTSDADSPLVTLLYTGWVGFLLLSVIVPFSWASLSWREAGLGLVTGLTATAAQWFIVLAYRQASASVLAPFFYSQLVWATLLGYMVFDHVPDLWTFTGTGVIVASGLYTAHRERVRAQG